MVAGTPPFLSISHCEFYGAHFGLPLSSSIYYLLWYWQGLAQKLDKMVGIQLAIH